MSQPEYGYSAKVSVDQFANSVNASNPGIYEIPLVHTDAKGRLWTTSQGSEEQLPMLDGVKLAPNKAYGSYTGSASLLITDKDGLLYYISGNDSSTMSRVTAYGSQIKTKPDSIVPLDSLFTDSTGKVWYVKSSSTLSIQATGTTGLNPNQVPGMPMLSSSRYFYTDSTGTLKNKSITSGNPTSPGLDGLPFRAAYACVQYLHCRQGWQNPDSGFGVTLSPAPTMELFSNREHGARNEATACMRPRGLIAMISELSRISSSEVMEKPAIIPRILPLVDRYIAGLE